MNLDQDPDFEVLPELTPEQEQRLDQEHRDRLTKFYQSSRPYSLDHWYNDLAHHTFKSVRFPLTCGQAYLLHCIYQEEQQKLSSVEISAFRQQLIEKVDAFIKQFFPKGCFMKLATRSPKDRGWVYSDSREEVEKVREIIVQHKAEISHGLMNQLYRYFLSQSKDKLRIQSGEDFIRIFAGSERIQIDLGDMSYLHKNAYTRMSEGDYSESGTTLVEVWGREWFNCEWHQEWRCFYNQYCLTAISQYDQNCYFPQLQGKEQLVQSAMQELFERIKPRLQQLQLPSGAMDVVFKPSQPEQPVVLIEVNVFDSNSRACLFDWKKQKHILEEGPLEVRIIKQILPICKYELCKMHGMIEKGIGRILDEAMKEANLEEQWQKME